MTMILASRDHHWYLAAFAPHLNGCNLSTVIAPPPSQIDRFHLWNGEVHVQSHAPLDGITFYPEVRYRGIRVYPQWWHPSSAEPLVHCWMQGIGDAVDPGRGRIEQSLDAQRRGDVALWASICEELKQKSQSMRAQLVSEGWKDKHIDGLERYCHVDDLDKIEGPPPVGEF